MKCHAAMFAAAVAGALALAACNAEKKAYTVADAIEHCGANLDPRNVTWMQMPRWEIRELFAKTHAKKQIEHRQINAFAEFNPNDLGRGFIFTEAPQGDWDTKTWRSVCHELEHIERGSYHDASGKDYR